MFSEDMSSKKNAIKNLLRNAVLAKRRRRPELGRALPDAELVRKIADVGNLARWAH
jgi:hypothetical protein